MKTSAFLLVALVIAAFGCNKTDATSAAPDAAMSAAPTASAAPVADTDLPVTADETEAASKDITKDNYKAQLDSLVQEVDKP